MSARLRSSRFMLWVGVCALLLKAAVPMIASAAATWQDTSVAEICTVYGVALPDPHAGHHDPAQHGHHDHAQHGGHEHDSHALAAHGGDHCALSALAALAPPDVATVDVPTAGQHGAPPTPAVDVPRVPDDCAIWVARLKHGPPVLA